MIKEKGIDINNTILIGKFITFNNNFKYDGNGEILNIGNPLSDFLFDSENYY